LTLGNLERVAKPGKFRPFLETPNASHLCSSWLCLCHQYLPSEYVYSLHPSGFVDLVLYYGLHGDRADNASQYIASSSQLAFLATLINLSAPMSRLKNPDQQLSMPFTDTHSRSVCQFIVLNPSLTASCGRFLTPSIIGLEACQARLVNRPLQDLHNLYTHSVSEHPTATIKDSFE
jgi:hypothetical protein